MPATFNMIAKTLQGLEEVLAEELITLGANDVEIGRRMVSFSGGQELLYRTNFCCRAAIRILKPIYSFRANNTDEVYDEIKKIRWEKYFSVDQTFVIDSTIYSDEFKHSKFVAYRMKDAIADYFFEKYEKRPSVRLTNADIYLNIHIAQNVCTISLDSSGESLHKRGYRKEQTEAPLNEVLAAGIILKTGWRGEKDFIDPMCGSGTFLIEAAMIALNIPPGVFRKGYAFEKWRDFDGDLFDMIYNDESMEREFNHKIYGSDVSSHAIEIARENIRSSGLAKYIELEVKGIQQYEKAPENGILVINPPYGERISSRDLLGLYRMIGERFKHVFLGYSCWILSYREECFESIGLKPDTKMQLFNGSLDCQLREYRIFSGKHKDYKREFVQTRQDKREFSHHDRRDFKQDRRDSDSERFENKGKRFDR